ncbi:MAG: peptide MFS transporter [Candidatus Symbiothrix sp.]|jgi:POT family proton-dependent oligopeptide transporter|nr:peptide MFS transporter [Candidatus Symbiothrix sp.]
MFKNHPKGLYALALANTGERFGYYTMLAIFTLFLQAKFGLSGATTSQIFGIFLAAVYFMPLVGGIIADKWWGYGKTVTVGIVVMFVGYVLMAIPSEAMVPMFGALALIAIGTGLFKGNLQVMVGNLYDDPKYQSNRDSAFSLFYMAINVGAMFAPTAAEKMYEHVLKKAHLTYDAQIPELAHKFLNGTISPEQTSTLTDLAAQQNGSTDLTAFSHLYINQLSEGYNYGFGVACVSLVFSMLIYLVFKNTYKHADYNSKELAAKNAAEGKTAEPELSPKETKDRIWALILVFIVVIFFWMSFHQNGLTMTFFARDYTSPTMGGFMRIGFNVINLALAVVAIYSLFSVFQSKTGKGKIISGGILLAAVGTLVYQYGLLPETINITPSIFQQFNPFFVVALTPVSLAVFGYLSNKKKEPSTPRKIGVGMLVAAIGFVILSVGSLGLSSPAVLHEGVSPILVSPNLLISTYLTLTFAELLLSPMGMSFVTKVAPPKYKGMMMGGWFAATGVGNYLVSIIGLLWASGMELWQIWGVLVVCCVLSAAFIFAIMKRLEKVAK